MASTGSSFVLLHGFTGCPSNWDEVVVGFPTGSKTHRPALLGHGSGRSAASSFEDEVDHLAGALESRLESPAVLAGYSMGGRVAIGLLVRHPQLFSAAILIGAHPGIEQEAARRRRDADDIALAERLEDRGIEDFVDFWQELPLFATQRRLPAATRERQRTRRLQQDPAGLAAALRILGPGKMPDYWPALGSLELPVHLLAGARDDKFCKIARAMAERIPRATVEIVEAAGHNLILEAPDAVARAIVDAAGVISRGNDHEHYSYR